jgi:PAS domain S-box-containing protein
MKYPVQSPFDSPSIVTQLVEASLDGALTFDRELRITYWNAAIERMTGLRAATVLGRPVAEVAPFLAHREAHGPTLSDVFSNRSWATPGEDYVVPATGRRGRFAARWSPLASADGSLARGIIIMRDITDENQAAKLISESEQRFAIMADSAPVLLWMAKEDAYCTFFNETWLRFTGRSLEEERGAGWASGIHIDDFQRCMDTYRRAFLRREPFEMEFRLRRADGQYRWLLNRGTPRLSPDGTFLGHIGSCVDIHDRRLAEEALALSETRMRTILDTASDGILSLTSSGRIDQANVAAQRLFGYTTDEIVGRDLNDLIEMPRLNSKSGSIPPPAPAGQRRLHLKRGEALGRRKDGKTFPMEVAVGTSGEASSSTVVVRDLSDRVSVERRVLQGREELQNSIGVDLHDGLGQLLTGVALLAKGLESRVPANEANTLGRLVKLINDAIRKVRALAKGLAPLHLENRDLGSVLEALAEQTRDVWQTECTVVGVHASPDCDANTKTQLFMIASEAVANAVKHGKATAIELEATSAGDYQVLEIRDNGSGITDDPRDGFGLQSMRYRARTIGGFLEILAPKDRGTTVRCYWQGA